MLLPEVNWHPNHKELRIFAIAAAVVATLVSLLLYWFKGLGLQWGVIISSAGAAILLTSLISPRATRMIYLVSILITRPIGLIVSVLLLAIFYFGVLTPLAIVFRVIGRDALNRKFDPDVGSYWMTHRQPGDLDRYFNQF